MLCLRSGMRSLPASQSADDGEADGTPVPPAVDPASEESLRKSDGTRKSVTPPINGRAANVLCDSAHYRFYLINVISCWIASLVDTHINE